LLKWSLEWKHRENYMDDLSDEIELKIAVFYQILMMDLKVLGNPDV